MLQRWELVDHALGVYLEMGRMKNTLAAFHCRLRDSVGLMAAELPGFLLVFRGECGVS